MVVKTAEEAWEIADKVFGAPCVKEEVESYHAGHAMYRYKRTNNFIADLGYRLEVMTDDIPTKNIWIADICMKEVGQEIEEEIAETAEEIAKWITLNLDKEGTSRVITFANEHDKNIIFPIAAQALYRIKEISHIKAMNRIKATSDEKEYLDICKEAEQTLHDTITPICNAHYTMYVPLVRVVEEWRKGESILC